MSKSTLSLDEIRASISRIDLEILRLLAQRRKISNEVAKNKIQTQKPVRDIKREQMLLEKLVLNAKTHALDPQYVIKIFQTIIEDSVLSQQEYLQRLANPDTEQPFVARVSFLGGIGSYSNLAAKHFFAKKNTQLAEIQCKNFKEVIGTVENGNADYGILPIENTSSGSINEVYDQLQHTPLSIVGEITQPIEHCLLVAQDTELKHIKNIYSHPQPQVQCSLFLDSLEDITHRYCSSTTSAMEEISALKSPHNAAIGNALSGEIYGLIPLQFNIANQKENHTRFIVVARKPVEVTALIPAKTTFIISTSQTPGSLVNCLLILRNHGINMIKLESRPVQGNPWEEMFYVDVEMNVHSEEMKKAMVELSELARYIKVLGCYPIENVRPTNIAI